jgi:Fe-S cluster assembly iron-binding protein IscA
MALDEPQESDVTFTDQNITFAIDRDLSEKAKPIRVDFVESVNGSGLNLHRACPKVEDVVETTLDKVLDLMQ